MGTEYVSHVVDAAHMKNIGEQSITNKIQAVLELVKNAYDGDALKCTVTFYGKRLSDENIEITKIKIQDFGIGMTKKDIKSKLMKVGTPNKIEQTLSPKFKRRVSGAKGMGHYSMQRLGTKTIITTTPEPYEDREFFNNDNTTYVLEIDWEKYVAGEDLQNISHKLITQKKENYYGTKIEISGLKDLWNVVGEDNDLERLNKNIGNMMLPEHLEKNKKNLFAPLIEAVGFDYKRQKPSGRLLEYAPYKIDAFLRGDKIFFKIFRRSKKYKIGFVQVSSRTRTVGAICGDANFSLYWFSNKLERWAKGLFNSKELESQLKENYGIKIYNDKVRIMPYGEKGNDWLGLDTRKAGPASGGLVRNPILIGLLEISRKKNPHIIETTTREAIKENAEFKSLKDDFVMKVIEELEIQVKNIVDEAEEYAKKTKPGNIAQVEIDRAREKIDESDSLNNYEKKLIDENLTKAYKQIIVQEQQNTKTSEELTANIEMYRNLATVGIQTIAFNHEIIDPIRFVKGTLTNLSNLYDELPEKDKKRYIMQSLERITHTLNWANRIKEFSSILAGADIVKRKRSVINISKTMNDIKDSLSAIFNTLDITMNDPIIDGNVPDIMMNKASFESIFINLISNSVRALKKVRDRKRTIKIKIFRNNDDILFQFEDNGYGISDKDIGDIFKPFFTTYKNPNDRGTGMGLTIIRDIVETDYHGTVGLKKTIYEDDSVGNGMTLFVIRLPLSEIKST